VPINGGTRCNWCWIGNQKFGDRPRHLQGKLSFVFTMSFLTASLSHICLRICLWTKALVRLIIRISNFVPFGQNVGWLLFSCCCCWPLGKSSRYDIWRFLKWIWNSWQIFKFSNKLICWFFHSPLFCVYSFLEKMWISRKLIGGQILFNCQS
jgi:hypothetical protein